MPIGCIELGDLQSRENRHSAKPSRSAIEYDERRSADFGHSPKPQFRCWFPRSRLSRPHRGRVACRLSGVKESMPSRKTFGTSPAALAAIGGNVAAPASSARISLRLIRSHCQRAASSAVARCVRLEGAERELSDFRHPWPGQRMNGTLSQGASGVDARGHLDSIVLTTAKGPGCVKTPNLIFCQG
jgi:hypothetical protein